MEKVHLFVDYRSEGSDATDYAVMMVGVVRGEHFYAKRVTPCAKSEGRPEEDYVKVKLSDLTEEKPRGAWEEMSIVVPSDLGLANPRIISMKPEQLPSHLRKELDYLAERCWE